MFYKIIYDHWKDYFKNCPNMKKTKKQNKTACSFNVILHHCLIGTYKGILNSLGDFIFNLQFAIY